MNKENLKPYNCPCCNSPAYFDMTVEPHTHHFAKFMPDVTGYTSFIFCSKCGLAISGDKCETEIDAKKNVLKKWNTRPEKQSDYKAMWEKLKTINFPCDFENGDQLEIMSEIEQEANK